MLDDPIVILLILALLMFPGLLPVEKSRPECPGLEDGPDEERIQEVRKHYLEGDMDAEEFELRLDYVLKREPGQRKIQE